MDKLYTIDEVAKYLKVGHKTVRKLIENNELVAVKVGGQYRIKEKELEKLVTKGG